MDDEFTLCPKCNHEIYQYDQGCTACIIIEAKELISKNNKYLEILGLKLNPEFDLSNLHDIVDDHLHDKFKRLSASLMDNQKLYNDFNPKLHNFEGEEILCKCGKPAETVISGTNSYVARCNDCMDDECYKSPKPIVTYDAVLKLTDAVIFKEGITYKFGDATPGPEQLPVEYTEVSDEEYERLFRPQDELSILRWERYQENLLRSKCLDSLEKKLNENL